MVDTETRENAFDILDDILKSGEVNMWTTSETLKNTLGLSRAETKEVFLSWINRNEEKE